MKKLKEATFDDYWNSLRQEQKDDFMLLSMAESTILQLSSSLRRPPSEQEIFDYLFKGGRKYKDLRQKERRLKELFEQFKSGAREKTS